MKPIFKNIIPITVESISTEQKGKALRALDRIKKLARQTETLQFILVTFYPNGNMLFSESNEMILVKDNQTM